MLRGSAMTPKSTVFRRSWTRPDLHSAAQAQCFVRFCTFAKCWQNFAMRWRIVAKFDYFWRKFVKICVFLRFFGEFLRKFVEICGIFHSLENVGEILRNLCESLRFFAKFRSAKLFPGRKSSSVAGCCSFATVCLAMRMIRSAWFAPSRPNQHSWVLRSLALRMTLE